MKKIVNWTFGSVFRTFGRVLAYILIGVLFSFIMSKSGLKITNLLGIDTIKASEITTTTPKGYSFQYDSCSNYYCEGSNDPSTINTGIKDFGTSTTINNGTYNYIFRNGIVNSYSFNSNNTYVFNYRIHFGGNSTNLNNIINLKLYNNWKFNVLGYKNSTDGYIDDYINSSSCSVRFDDSTNNGFLVSCNVALNVNVSRINIQTLFYNPDLIYGSEFLNYNFSSVRVNLISVIENEGQGALIDKQTNQLINNQNKNTEDIINNNNENTDKLINNQNEMLGNRCDNLVDLTTNNYNGTYTSGGITWKVSKQKINGSGTATSGSSDIGNTSTTFSINLIGGQTYKFCLNKQITSNMYFRYYDGDTWKNASTNGNSCTTFTPTNNITKAYIFNGNRNSGTVININDLQIYVGKKSFCEYGSYTSKLDDTNNSINDLKDSIMDDSSPSLSGLDNDTVAGWLPAGPVDSILNLPLTMINSLINGMSGSCAPLRVPLPYVNMELPIPCMSTVYSQMGFGTFFNWVGNIAAAFILFRYLLKLYKYVDDTLTFRENNFIDNWSGV